MKYEVLENIRLRTTMGEQELHAGQIIQISEDIALQLLKVGKIRPQQIPYEPSTAEPIWVNPYPQGTSEARRHTLEFTMDQMLVQAARDFQECGYKNTPEAHTAQVELGNLYYLILDGVRPITDFQKAIDRWKYHAGQSFHPRDPQKQRTRGMI
jgi:hypothetical protein